MSGEIGALIVLEAHWPSGTGHRERARAMAWVAEAIAEGPRATTTARLTFEPDKVEWVVAVGRDELPEMSGEYGLWARLDRELTETLSDAVARVRAEAA